MYFAKVFNKMTVFFSMILLSLSVNASEGTLPYNASLFNKAQAENKMIVVDVYKDGCGTCARQKPALTEARTQYPDAAFFRVDFANDKEAVKRFRAIKQSTIIVFKGKLERGRVLGETNKDKILAMISQGVS